MVGIPLIYQCDSWNSQKVPRCPKKIHKSVVQKITGDLLRLAGFSSLCIVAAIRKVIGVELGELGERPFVLGDQSLLQHEIRISVYRYILMVFFISFSDIIVIIIICHYSVFALEKSPDIFTGMSRWGFSKNFLLLKLNVRMF